MYKIEQEIFSQYEALKQTYSYFLDKADTIKAFFGNTQFKSITFIGSGSSYSLSKSAVMSLKLRSEIKVNSIAAGDLMLNFDQYKNMIKDTLFISLSRSGSTSEVILAVKKAKQDMNIPCISICMVENSELSKIANLNLELPWTFDNSVCQTRTVTNLYTASLLLTAIMTGDTGLLDEVGAAVEAEGKFIEQNTAILKEVANTGNWESAVILADGELEGIAEEGALAFKEICQLQSNYYHILDVRHGPMVIIRDKSLVIMAAVPSGDLYQKGLIADLRKQGALVLTVSDRADNILGSDYNITIPSYKKYAVSGIPFIFVPQVISYYKALKRGTNPDKPQGLSAWIEL